MSPPSTSRIFQADFHSTMPWRGVVRQTRQVALGAVRKRLKVLRVPPIGARRRCVVLLHEVDEALDRTALSPRLIVAVVADIGEVGLVEADLITQIVAVLIGHWTGWIVGLNEGLGQVIGVVGIVGRFAEHHGVSVRTLGRRGIVPPDRPLLGLDENLVGPPVGLPHYRTLRFVPGSPGGETPPRIRLGTVATRQLRPVHRDEGLPHEIVDRALLGDQSGRVVRCRLVHVERHDPGQIQQLRLGWRVPEQPPDRGGDQPPDHQGRRPHRRSIGTRHGTPPLARRDALADSFHSCIAESST